VTIRARRVSERRTSRAARGPRCGRAAFAGLSLLSTLFAAANAAAYRPFDGTDGGVAETGHFELELGPAHYYRERDVSYLIAPATVLNLGIAHRLELVSDFQNFVTGERLPGVPRARVLNTDVLVKWVAREGVLQDKTGPSIAFEGGVLTPELGGNDGFGAQLDAIVSVRGKVGALHLNSQIADAHDHHVDWFESLILEGPDTWSPRPVAELYFDNEFGGTRRFSALAGLIWDASPYISLDAAGRYGTVDGHPVEEVRFGFTLVVPVWDAK